MNINKFVDKIKDRLCMYLYSFEQTQALFFIPDESYSVTNYFDILSEAVRAHEVLFYIPLTKDQTVQREYCR